MVSRSKPPRPPTPPAPSATPPELSFEDFVRWSMAVSDLGAVTARRDLGGIAGRVYLGGQLWIQETPGGCRAVVDGQEKITPDLQTLERFLYDRVCDLGLCRRKDSDDGASGPEHSGASR